MVIVLIGFEWVGCFCVDFVSKLGRCKYVVGLLFWCKNEKNVCYFKVLWEFYVFFFVDIFVCYYLYGEYNYVLMEMIN